MSTYGICVGMSKGHPVSKLKRAACPKARKGVRYASLFTHLDTPLLSVAIVAALPRDTSPAQSSLCHR